MPDPVISPGQEGASLVFSENWFDEFDGTQGLLSDRWFFDDMSDALHRTGNKDILADGTSSPGSSVSGKRWSAWYPSKDDANAPLVAREESGDLVMPALLTNESDPTRTSFVKNGVTYNPQNHRIYLAFLTTWARQYSNDAGGHITHPDSANRTWGPGHFFEFELDLSGMDTPGCRFSIYLLPSGENDSNAYDSDGANGVEIDIPEYDPSPGFEQHLQIKVISGAAGGNTPNGSIDIAAQIAGIDLRTGRHTVGLLWRASILVMYVDGIEVIRDESVTRIPQVPHYLVISREANSGAKDSPSAGELQAVPPYIPEDVGIFATNVWEHKDRLNTDIAKVGYVRVWGIDGDSGVSTGGGTVTSAATGLNPRLVINMQPAIRQGRPAQQIVAIPKDGYDPTGKTFTWSSTVSELTFLEQGTLTTTPSLQGLSADELATITIDDGE